MLTPRSKAFALSAVLVLVSGAFVATAAASTTSALAPLRSGDDYPLERGLSRHGSAIAIIVGASVDGQPQRVEGAQVTLTRLNPDAAEVPVATKETDDQGRAVFQARKGGYRVDVVHGTFTASREFRLHEPQRAAVYFDESGRATWGQADHRALQKRGETANLLVRVVDGAGREAAPVEGASVKVYRIEGDARTLAGEGTTSPRGAAAFHLHRGPYEVEVSHEGESERQRLRLHGDARLVFDLGDGGDAPRRGR